MDIQFEWALSLGETHASTTHDLSVNVSGCSIAVTVCDKQNTHTTFFCFELTSILHNISVALKELINIFSVT